MGRDASRRPRRRHREYSSSNFSSTVRGRASEVLRATDAIEYVKASSLHARGRGDRGIEERTCEREKAAMKRGGECRHMRRGYECRRALRATLSARGMQVKFHRYCFSEKSL